MTLYDLLHDISQSLTDDPDILFKHFIKGGIEDKDIGEAWWFVIGFENEFFVDDFETNPYRILYISKDFQDPKEAEDFLKSKNCIDLYTKRYIK